MLQYVLMVVIVLGMFVVIVVSAKNYTPIEWVVLAFFLVVISIVGSNYFFGVNVATSLKNVTTGKPQIGVEVMNEEKEKGKDEAASDTSKGSTSTSKSNSKAQVFHVPGQYSYTDAKALCRAYGGSLANIQQMMEAHQQGAEWCDYGWSDDQMALYPTQMKTWKEFKETDVHKTDCGRPGVNGGYTMDLTQLLGANCFASKPPAPKGSKIQGPPIPMNPLDVEAEKYKSDLPNVSPFNYEKWNE